MSNSGFSLLELIVVMSIVAILSAAAIPSYNKYIFKAQITQVLTVAEGYKLNLIDNPKAKYNVNSDLIDYIVTTSNDNMPMKYIIHVASKIKNGLIMQLHGVDDGEMIKWSCHVPLEYNNFMPRSCRNNNLEQIEIG